VCFRAVRAITRGGRHTRAVRFLEPARRDGIAPIWRSNGQAGDSKAAGSKTHAPSESTPHGEDTLGVNARDDATERRRSPVFLGT
jgi:hypothetical protein